MTGRFGLAAMIAVLVGCSHPGAPASTELATAPKMYTQTNLHTDPGKGLIYTANYQLAGLIPRCTEVAMGERYSREVAFTVVASGAHYLYRLSPNLTPEGLEANVAKYFASTCDSTATRNMTEIDQKGILAGKATVGMSKQAVLFANGYPPMGDTPDIKSDRWHYWTNKYSSFIVIFTNGLVTSIENGAPAK
jgi:hypothetical protein